jgi:hypothetical protein
MVGQGKELPTPPSFFEKRPIRAKERERRRGNLIEVMLEEFGS